MRLLKQWVRTQPSSIRNYPALRYAIWKRHLMSKSLTELSLFSIYLLSGPKPVRVSFRSNWHSTVIYCPDFPGMARIYPVLGAALGPGAQGKVS
ncbi:hypothetical protein D3C86_1843890 [compost metagenome]